MIDERFYSEYYPTEYYTEIIDKEKKLDSTIPNPKRNLTLTEVVDLLNELNQEAKDNEHYHTEVLRSYKAVSEENEQLKKALLFYIDVSLCETSSNFNKDFDNICNNLFGCSYNEIKHLYADISNEDDVFALFQR